MSLEKVVLLEPKIIVVPKGYNYKEVIVLLSWKRFDEAQEQVQCCHPIDYREAIPVPLLKAYWAEHRVVLMFLYGLLTRISLKKFRLENRQNRYMSGGMWPYKATPAFPPHEPPFPELHFAHFHNLRPSKWK